MAQLHLFNRSRFDASVEIFETDSILFEKPPSASVLFRPNAIKSSVWKLKNKAPVMTSVASNVLNLIFNIRVAKIPKATIKLSQLALAKESMRAMTKKTNNVAAYIRKKAEIL